MDSPTWSRNINPLHQLYGTRRTVRWVVFLVLAALATLYITGQSYTPLVSTTTAFRPSKNRAKYLSPEKLMERPISKDLQTIPRLFHQSWSAIKLPAKFERWSDSCRRAHPNWEWVLWTDEDNENLVKKHFPWLLQTYQDLPGAIYKADLARNLYMYMYGGVYADLDVECLRPSDEIFNEYNVSTVSHSQPRPVSTHDLQKSGRKAFFGRMGTDINEANSIPNAWMASTPGHPFFLLVIENVVKGLQDGSRNGQAPESVTGPARLFEMVNEYHIAEGLYAGEKLDQHVAKNPTAKHFTPRKGLKHSVEVLPFYYIYPYSWLRDGEAFRDVCWVSRVTFDAETCKLLLATDRWPSYTITYWSHSWAESGHDEGSLRRLEDD